MDYVGTVLQLLPYADRASRYVPGLRRFLYERASIELKLPPEKRQKDWATWGVLHVRDGKEDVEAGPLLNQVHRFRASETALEAHFWYRRTLGCQFKCFAEPAPDRSEEVRQALASLGFVTSPTSSEKARIYFLLPGYSTYTTPDHLQNNLMMSRQFGPTGTA